jgi:adenylylsulfate kinase
LEVCEGRDVKGLYKRARAGEIKNYTGIDSPYEIPKNPELVIETDKESLEASVSKIFSFLESKGVFK